jgi:fructose-1,6-bisphosphatase/inositol monophosphatase family enzyme
MKPSIQLKRLHASLSVCLRELASEIRDRVSRLENLHRIATRADGDTTHSFDVDAESRIIDTLERSGLNMRVLTEETDEVVLGTGRDYIAIVDPIDGSDMVARGYPLASIAVSIVDSLTREPILSHIYEIFTSTHFTAVGGTATRNRLPMKPSTTTSLKDSFIVTYSATPSRRASEANRKVLVSDAMLVLNYGGPLDLAKVGSGQCDGMIEATKGFPPRDFVAGYHIASCAGAVSCSLEGYPLKIDVEEEARTKFLIAGNETLLKEMLLVLA